MYVIKTIMFLIVVGYSGSFRCYRSSADWLSVGEGGPGTGLGGGPGRQGFKKKDLSVVEQYRIIALVL